ncbi:hypothetical protein SAMN05661008_01618 [Alkalithermobacter thermoalcaliphilus JW-YL-7 = DSM 7308]|uniref:Uncharacterized protein n=1 Tax=Alkalithermobacter thermoalcaliphilus JW-YL-7 = DSM 7308 TaxID=1121328 RepID=A0A150FST7_CLOPD|nr:hypothetical protein JWYL7_1744 [[Clostridium] paradoxum JW-YL-7 = DSM 7308]SHL18292.1 hypothetical protein SAMN05661008_01618 [[Clostridium] paradoxum JW-YL-7 = DSM 7308]
MVLGLIAGFIIAIFIDLLELLRSDDKPKIIIIYSLLIIIAFTTSLLQIIDKAPPSPAVFITKIVESIVGGIK